MANYYAKARSNYFGVKDEAAFLEDMANMGVEVSLGYGFTEGLFMVIGEEGWPGSAEDPDTGDYKDIDFIAEVQKHLVDDHVCILQEVGSEAMRYLVGMSIAFNNRGEVRSVNIDEIPGIEELGSHITSPTY